ncbi:PC3-like endoprotease variant B [Acropora palmata]|uniref:PC3-like endoprotease variant B n=1 Tax=Acropora palmata TaxID=6131 RepID=UPI003DA0E5D4
MKPVRWRVYITLFFLASEIDCLLGKPSRKLRKLGKQTLKTTPKLTRQEWEQLHKFEDALKSEDGKLLFTNSWAVQLDPAEIKVADRIARKHGFINYGQVGSLRGYYHFKHENTGLRQKRFIHEKTKLLLSEDEVVWAEHQHVLERTRKDGIPLDPKFKDQWYLLNQGQSTGPAGVDVDVMPVWRQDITGKGVVVSILDDGVDHTHPDLRDNFDQKASYDFNDMDADPKPRDSDPDNCHGTRCAGEVAAVANNSACGVGVAYDANIGGVRMLDGQATDVLEGSSLSFQSEYIDIYSNCWGPKDDGKTFGKPGKLAQEALMQGALKGRGGKGNIYVWATGNGGLTDDDCNCDGYTTSIYTISVGCIGDHGLSAYYTELCSSTLAVTFNGGSHREKEENKMVTTDLHHKCTEEFKGTSSAAPLAAGMFALVLQANPNLSWRDVQHVVVETAQVTSPVDEGWMKNGAGYHFNHKFGFGRLDAAALVKRAKTWKTVAPQRTCHGPSSQTQQEIPAGGTLSITIDTIACDGTDKEISKLEHVTLTVSFQHRRRGDVSIDLFSPSGTRNEMLSTRRYDDSKNGLHDWTFMTVHNWGENPKGVWVMNVTDNIATLNKGVDVNGYLQHDTSKQEADVEDLEEEVIDDEKKTQELEAKKTGKDDSNVSPSWDAPYPEGVKKHKIHSPDNEEDSAKRDEGEEGKNKVPGNLEADEWGEYDPGTFDTFVPEDFQNGLGMSENPGVFFTSYETPEDPLENNDYQITSAAKKTLENSGETGDDESDKVYGYDKYIYSNEPEEAMKVSESKRTDTDYQGQRVQVTTEETGSQRVQVNNGFQEEFVPGLNPESGRISSGVFLEWKLTFYGTGPEDSVSGDDDTTSDLDIDL